MDMINFLEVEVSKNDWGATNLGSGSEAQKSGSHQRGLNIGPAMGEITRCVCNLKNFESGRVEGRVEIGFKKIELEYSDLWGILNSIFGRVK